MQTLLLLLSLLLLLPLFFLLSFLIVVLLLELLSTHTAVIQFDDLRRATLFHPKATLRSSSRRGFHRNVSASNSTQYSNVVLLLQLLSANTVVNQFEHPRRFLSHLFSLFSLLLDPGKCDLCCSPLASGRRLHILAGTVYCW